MIIYLFICMMCVDLCMYYLYTYILPIVIIVGQATLGDIRGILCVHVVEYQYSRLWSIEAANCYSTYQSLLLCPPVTSHFPSLPARYESISSKKRMEGTRARAWRLHWMWSDWIEKNWHVVRTLLQNWKEHRKGNAGVVWGCWIVMWCSTASYCTDVS